MDRMMAETSNNGQQPKSPAPAETVHHPGYVVLEGCIGVGKTTLADLWSDAVDAKTILEVVEENPFLPEFYEDPKAHAFKTQMFFLLSRFKQQEQLSQPDLFQQRVVADYLFAKDRIFAELTLSGSELSLYEQVFNALQAQVRNPELAILGYGVPTLDALKVAKGFEGTYAIDVYDARFAKPIDGDLLEDILTNDIPIITVEDHSIAGGFGAAILEEASSRKLDSSLITRLALPDRWIGHGSRAEQLREAGIDMEGIARCVSQILEKRPTSKPAIEQPTTSG